MAWKFYINDKQQTIWLKMSKADKHREWRILWKEILLPCCSGIKKKKTENG